MKGSVPIELARRSRPLVNGLIWLLFCTAVVFATAPVWRLWLLGFNPTFDQILRMSLCGGDVNIHTDRPG